MHPRYHMQPTPPPDKLLLLVRYWYRLPRKVHPGVECTRASHRDKTSEYFRKNSVPWCSNTYSLKIGSQNSCTLLGVFVSLFIKHYFDELNLNQRCFTNVACSNLAGVKYRRIPHVLIWPELNRKCSMF